MKNKLYRLKPGQEAFRLVDGPMAGRVFRPGERYEQIPTGMKARFETAAPATAAPTRTGKQRPASTEESAS
jgi:hypothetical protein